VSLLDYNGRAVDIALEARADLQSPLSRMDYLEALKVKE
jgi:hypothetical protein